MFIGPTGYDGDTFKRQQLMDRYGIQINKTSRNSVLFMTNIGTTRSSVAFLVEVLVNIARELDQDISEMSLGEREHFEQAVYRLTEMSLPLPDFSGFHPTFMDHSGSEPTPEGDVRRAFYLSYDDTNCEYLTGEQIDERLDAGVDIVSATYVTPVPSRISGPGARPGVQPRDTAVHARPRHARDPRVPTEFRLPRVYREGHRDSRRVCRVAVQRSSCRYARSRRRRRKHRRKSRRSAVAMAIGTSPRSVSDELVGQQQPGDALHMAAPPGDQDVAEVGVEELSGEQYPGDAVQANARSGDQLD